MNLKDRLDKMQQRPVPPDAVSLSDLAPISRADIRARQEDALRRHMKSQGSSDAEVKEYIASPRALAA